jgi:hypothetical protein
MDIADTIMTPTNAARMLNKHKRGAIWPGARNSRAKRQLNSHSGLTEVDKHKSRLALARRTLEAQNCIRVSAMENKDERNKRNTWREKVMSN